MDLQTAMATSPHHELITAMTDLYTLLDTMAALGEHTVQTPPYHPNAINRAAASTAGFTADTIDLMALLPYLDVESHDSYELLPSTWPVSYLGEDQDELYFECRREMLFDELMPPTALRLTWSEGMQGTEFIYDTQKELLVPWTPTETPEDVNDYFQVPDLPPREALAPLITACQSLNYLGIPDGLDFNHGLYSESGGQAPKDWPEHNKQQWRAQYAVWGAVRKLKDIYLDCGWNVDTLQQPDFRRDEFVKRRQKHWEDVVQPLRDREEEVHNLICVEQSQNDKPATHDTGVRGWFRGWFRGW